MSDRVSEEFRCTSVVCWLAKNQDMSKTAFCAGPMRMAALYLVGQQTIVRRSLNTTTRRTTLRGVLGWIEGPGACLYVVPDRR
jgi:hypothetical protein